MGDHLYTFMRLMKAQIIGGEFVWNIIWEKDCFAFICRVLKCLYLMDKAPLEQVGIGLDATYKPMERGGVILRRKT